jgi:hypothetical protein
MQDERRDHCVPERHRNERDAKARLRGDRRQVAVEQVDKRHLQRIRCPHHKCSNSHVQRRDATHCRKSVEPVGQAQGQRLSEDQ